MDQICGLAVADIADGGGGAPMVFVVLVEAEEWFEDLISETLRRPSTVPPGTGG